jgi:hypothetical protein
MLRMFWEARICVYRKYIQHVTKCMHYITTLHVTKCMRYITTLHVHSAINITAALQETVGLMLEYHKTTAVSAMEVGSTHS